MTVMERILGTLRAILILGAVCVLAWLFASVIIVIMEVAKYPTDHTEAPIDIFMYAIANEPAPAPVAKEEISVSDSVAPSEPGSLWKKIEQRLLAVYGKTEPSEIMRGLHYLWYIVPVQLFQGPGEEGEYSKEVLSRSLTSEQMAAIFQYYDEAIWDPVLARQLFSFAEQKYKEQGEANKAIVATIVVNGVVNNVHVMGYNPPKDEYFVAIRRDDKWWQVLGVDGTGNVIPYIDVFPPWINHPRRPRYEVENLMVAWMGN